MSEQTKKAGRSAAKKSITAYAASKLELRDVSIQDMRKYLLDKGFEKEEVESTIENLISLEYLDDIRFSSGYFRRALAKNKSRRRAEAELLNKGVSKNDIDDGYARYVEENGEPDEYEIAMREAEKVLRLASAGDGELTDKLKGRIARRLASKGFSPGTAYRVLDEIRSARRF